MVSDADLQRFLLFALEAVGGGLIAVLWMQFKDMQKRQADSEVAFYTYKLHVAESYVTHHVLTKSVDALGKAFDGSLAS